MGCKQRFGKHWHALFDTYQCKPSHSANQCGAQCTPMLSLTPECLARMIDPIGSLAAEAMQSPKVSTCSACHKNDCAQAKPEGPMEGHEILSPTNSVKRCQVTPCVARPQSKRRTAAAMTCRRGQVDRLVSIGAKYIRSLGWLLPSRSLSVTEIKRNHCSTTRAENRPSRMSTQTQHASQSKVGMGNAAIGRQQVQLESRVIATDGAI